VRVLTVYLADIRLQVWDGWLNNNFYLCSFKW
jgi:hypothetical protein